MAEFSRVAEKLINILLKPQVPGVICLPAGANGMFGKAGLELDLSAGPTALAFFGFPGSDRNYDKCWPFLTACVIFVTSENQVLCK